MQDTDEVAAAPVRQARDVVVRGVTGAGIAVGGNLVISALLVVLLDVGRGFDPLRPRAVGVTTLGAALLGVLVAVVLARTTVRAGQWFALAAWVTAAGSYAIAAIVLGVDPAYPDTRTGTVLALLPLHLLPAASLVLMLRAVLSRAGN
jgi:hypothetical protein